MDDRDRHVGLIAATTAAFLAFAGIVRALPIVLALLIKFMRTLVEVSDAMPSIRKLPQTLKEHGEMFAEQNIILSDIQKDVKELKQSQPRKPD